MMMIVLSEFNNFVAVSTLICEVNCVKIAWRLHEMINIWTLNDDACLHCSGVEAPWMPILVLQSHEKI